MELPLPIDSESVPNLSQTLHSPQTIVVDSGEFRIYRVRLTSGVQAGCELLVIDDDCSRTAICTTRGMSLWKARLGEVQCGWDSPVSGPVHPSFVPTYDPSGIGWLEGFDELLVRCGMRSFGPPEFDSAGNLALPLHGRVANLAAENVRISFDAKQSTLNVRGDVFETRFLCYRLKLEVSYTFRCGQSKIEIEDSITNLGSSESDAQLLYHINLGQPVLAENARFDLSADAIVARDARAEEGIADWQVYSGPTPGYAEQVYFSQPIADSDGWAHAMLENPATLQAVAVHFQTSGLPYFSQWKNTEATCDGYVTGMEPATGFPNPQSFEAANGRVLRLGGGETKQFQLVLETLAGEQPIRSLRERIASLRQNEQPVKQGFRENWCVPR